MIKRTGKLFRVVAMKLVLVMLLSVTMLTAVAQGAGREWLPPAENVVFTDVGGHWALRDGYIGWAVANDITTGFPNNTFRPGANVTRAEFVTFLYRIAGNPSVSGSNPFGDVRQGEWYTNAVMWASATGVTTGTSSTTFEPDRPITREALATMLHRHIQNVRTTHLTAPVNAINNFHGGEQVSGWALGSVRWAAYYGIIGRGGSLDARSNASRAETVAMLRRVANDFLTEGRTPEHRPPPAPILGSTPGANEFEAEVFRLTNIERTSRGLPPLHWHTGLGQVSRDFSRDMYTRGFFDHTCPSGTNPTDRVRAVGIVYTWGAGENLAMGHRTPQDVVRGWMNSPGHRANILHSDVTHLGVGFYNYRWTQKFIILPGIDELLIHPITNDMYERAARTAFVLFNYNRELRTAYSRSLIITRLIEHGFTQAQAEYGVDNLNADWYRQAVRAAQDMLGLEWNATMSREWLIRSLTDEWRGFTPSQAEYGVDNSGADWYERAVMAARRLVELWYERSAIVMSRETLIIQLGAHGFTPDEAEFAATAVGVLS